MLMLIESVTAAVMPEACRILAGWWSEPRERNHRIIQIKDRAPAGVLEQANGFRRPYRGCVYFARLESGGSASLYRPANFHCPSRTKATELPEMSNE